MILKRAVPFMAAVVLCTAFSSCTAGESGAEAEVIIDDIETEEVLTVSETESEEIISETETAEEIIAEVTETSAEVSAETKTEAAVTEIVKPSETQTEAASDVISDTGETLGGVLGEITDFNITLTYPTADGKSADYTFCAANRINTRVYLLAAGGNGAENTSAYITYNQLKNVLEKISGITVYADGEKHAKENVCAVTAKNAAGDSVYSEFAGDIPEELTSLSEELRRLAGSGFDSEKFNEMQTNIPNAISNGAVPVYACLSSNIDRYVHRDGDGAVYAGKSLILKSADEVNAAADFLENEPVMPISEEWEGFAFVKFAEDGSIEYVNWSEEESGLSENPLTYDDCMAYYIENGKVIAFADYRK